MQWLLLYLCRILKWKRFILEVKRLRHYAWDASSNPGKAEIFSPVIDCPYLTTPDDLYYTILFHTALELT